MIGTLGAYIAEHFDREERFMRRAGYPGFAEHKRRHDELTAQVRALDTLYEREPDSVDPEKLLAFLKDWLVKHIMGDDQAFVPYLKPEEQSDASDEALFSDGRLPRARRIDVSVKVTDIHAPLIRRLAEICDSETKEARELRDALTDFVSRYEAEMIARARAAFGSKQ